MKIWTTVLALLPLLSFAACGDDAADGAGSTPGGSGGGSGAAGTGASGVDGATCVDVASAVCAKFRACLPFVFETAYPDDASCIERNAKVCKNNVDAPGMSLDAKGFSACADALDEASCDEFFAGEPAVCTAAPGSLSEGDACGADGQCESGNCTVEPGSMCGTCGKVVEHGGDCAGYGAACEAGTVCDPDTEICVKPNMTGGECGPGAPCVTGLVCLDGMCQKPGQEGDACSAQAPCDFFRGLQCVEEKCVPIPIGDVGAACGLADGKYSACKGGTSCVKGKCIAAIPDGEPCETSEDTPACLAPAACIDGICKLADVSICE